MHLYHAEHLYILDSCEPISRSMGYPWIQARQELSYGADRVYGSCFVCLFVPSFPPSLPGAGFGLRLQYSTGSPVLPPPVSFYSTVLSTTGVSDTVRLNST